jgi:GNAT superfamily N-acetyltransferase
VTAAADDVTIRPAHEREVEAVLAMYEWLFEPPGYTPRQWDPDSARASIIDAIRQPQTTVLVAELPGGELVGLITAYLDLRSVRFGLRCWVEDLAVGPSHRSRGIGRLLLDTAKRWAADRGATHLELDTGFARTDAQRFYEQEIPIATGYSYSWAL